MIKGVIFDLDGVLIQEFCYASKLFEKLYRIPHEEFYQVIKDNKMLQRTEKNGSNFKLFSELLKKYNVKISEGKFWDLWFTNFEVKGDVVDFALSLKNSGKNIGIISDNFVERVEHLRNNLPWIKKFDCVLFSSDFGITKNNPKLFEILIEKIGLKPEEIFFTDDDEENIKVARSVGIKGIKFNDLEAIKVELTDILDDYLPQKKRQYEAYKKGWKRKYK